MWYCSPCYAEASDRELNFDGGEAWNVDWKMCVCVCRIGRSLSFSAGRRVCLNQSTVYPARARGSSYQNTNSLNVLADAGSLNDVFSLTQEPPMGPAYATLQQGS